MTKNITPTPVYLDPGMHSGLEVKGLSAFRVPLMEQSVISMLILYNIVNVQFLCEYNQQPRDIDPMLV